MKKESWFVVANSSIARFYRKEQKNLIAVNVLEHPESRLHNRDLVSDKPGRDFESMGATRHSLEPKHSPHDKEMVLFAKQIASYLETVCNKGDIERLYLAASPIMLGKLRQELNSNTNKLIYAEVDKDLTHSKPEEILNHFLAIH